jgi:hypothetical protein
MSSEDKAAKTKQNEVLVLREEYLCKDEEDEVDLPLPPLPLGLPGLRTRNNNHNDNLRRSPSPRRGLLFVLQAEKCHSRIHPKRNKDKVRISLN